MSCCGQNRRRFHHPQGRATSTNHSVVYFIYRGPTALRVRGPVTGRLYAFTAPGMRLMVDARDQRGLASIPNLEYA